MSFEVAGHFSDGFITAVFPLRKYLPMALKHKVMDNCKDQELRHTQEVHK